MKAFKAFVLLSVAVTASIALVIPRVSDDKIGLSKRCNDDCFACCCCAPWIHSVSDKSTITPSQASTHVFNPPKLQQISDGKTVMNEQNAAFGMPVSKEAAVIKNELKGSKAEVKIVPKSGMHY